MIAYTKARLQAGLLVVALLLATLSPSSQAGTFSEYEVKAALLYNVAKFISWPEDRFLAAGESFDICVLSSAELVEAFRPLETRRVGTHPIVVKRFDAIDATVRQCEILFVAEERDAGSALLTEQLRDTAVLTIGETEQFVDTGGIMAMVLESSRVNFVINPDAAAETRLVVSSQLLALARVKRPAAGDLHL